MIVVRAHDVFTSICIIHRLRFIYILLYFKSSATSSTAYSTLCTGYNHIHPRRSDDDECDVCGDNTRETVCAVQVQGNAWRPSSGSRGSSLTNPRRLVASLLLSLRYWCDWCFFCVLRRIQYFSRYSIMQLKKKKTHVSRDLLKVESRPTHHRRVATRS